MGEAATRALSQECECGGGRGEEEQEEQEQDDEEQEECVFCLISKDQDQYADVIRKNDELVCFRDIDPAAPQHYLVIPREHIVSCFSLTQDHVCLVEKMADLGKAALRDQGITDMNDIRVGFHKPPFTSVRHLHLHVLAPASQISDYMLHKFIPCTNRFISEDHLRMCLLKKKKKVKKKKNLQA